MPHSSSFLNEAQRAVLRWVADGSPTGIYEGATHRITARALHNRGLVEVSGKGASWQATITRQGEARLAEEDARLAADAEKARLEIAARLEEERGRQDYLNRCVEFVESVIANGGRLDVGRELDAYDVARMRMTLSGSGSMPSGRRLACEPTRMDPSLGLTVYLEPDFAQVVRLQRVRVPPELRITEPLVHAFTRKRSWVTKNEIPRAARILQAFSDAVRTAGWGIDDRAPSGHGERDPDLVLKLPIGRATATIYELDARDRRVSMYTERRDYSDPRVHVVTRNQRVEASGSLELAVAQEWGKETFAVARDHPGRPLEESLSELVHTLAVLAEEAKWAAAEEARRTHVRAERWTEVRAAAVLRVEEKKREEQLSSEMHRRETALRMLRYAAEVEEHATTMDPLAWAAAIRWAQWIRQHAVRTDPLDDRLQLLEVSDATPTELEPYMGQWSPFGPHLRRS